MLICNNAEKLCNNLPPTSQNINKGSTSIFILKQEVNLLCIMTNKKNRKNKL